ncbi:hypothetical protein FQN49_004165 [Arthroderma sp. PD_2]|nr:hypothetical protein FQN49_004165 [Arthroderma sp. PD_2]
MPPNSSLILQQTESKELRLISSDSRWQNSSIFFYSLSWPPLLWQSLAMTTANAHAGVKTIIQSVDIIIQGNASLKLRKMDTSAVVGLASLQKSARTMNVSAPQIHVEMTA